MTRTAVIGMALIIFALAGCNDPREIKSLKNKVDSHSDEIAFLNKRVKAIEEAYLQLNERITGMGSKESTQARPTEYSSAPAKSSNRLTRNTFNERLSGLTLAEVMAILGKPDKVSDQDNSQTWTYRQVNLATESGGEEKSSAIVFFENGSVSRANLTADANKQTPDSSL